MASSTDTDAEGRSREPAEARGDDRDELAAILGHELRNPLASMCNAVRLLRSSSLGAAKRERALDILERQLSHLSRLVQDLVDASRLARGRLELRREEVDLARVVHDEVEAFRGIATDRTITVVLELPGEPVTVSGDRVRLAQILAILVHNAIRFTERGGHVVVRLDAAEDQGAVVRVSDDGIGMSPDFLARLFEPFATADHSLSRSRSGLGISLALARALVALHGGTIEAESQGSGLGAMFTVHLPLAPHPVVLPTSVP